MIEDSMNHEEFYQEAQKPEFPDEMGFELRVENPENKNSFSIEGIETLVDQIQTFIMARVLGNWEKFSSPPKVMRVAVKLKMEPGDDIKTLGLPWYQLAEDGSLLQIDPKSRIPRTKKRGG